MTNISDIDKKILYSLGDNARLSLKQISTKLKSKKQIIAYHLKQLEKKDIIWKHVPVFSLNRLGIYAYKIYFKLHGLTAEEKTKLITKLIKKYLPNAKIEIKKDLASLDRVVILNF